MPQVFAPPQPENLTRRKQNTHRKTNMSPENQWLEDAFPIEIAPF